MSSAAAAAEAAAAAAAASQSSASTVRFKAGPAGSGPTRAYSAGPARHLGAAGNGHRRAQLRARTRGMAVAAAAQYLRESFGASPRIFVI